jgi:hypothetical protein
MPQKLSVQETKNKLARIYAVGILAFSALVGSITLLALFLGRVNLN